MEKRKNKKRKKKDLLDERTKTSNEEKRPVLLLLCVMCRLCLFSRLLRSRKRFDEHMFLLSEEHVSHYRKLNPSPIHEQRDCNLGPRLVTAGSKLGTDRERDAGHMQRVRRETESLIRRHEVRSLCQRY